MHSPLRVLVNDRPLRQTLTGVGHYIDQLLTHLPVVAPDIAAAPFFYTHIRRRDWRRHARQPAAAPAPARRPRDVGGSRKPWWLRRILQAGYGALFRRAARSYDLYHEPNHIPMPCDRPTVTTVHDLSVLLFPQWHPADRVRWYEAEFAAGVRRTQRFLAASEFTKTEMVRHAGIAPERIEVTYQAPRPTFAPVAGGAVPAARGALQLPERFFLYVGTLEPRKNVPLLLEAYQRLPAAVRGTHPLLLVGAWGWHQQELRERLARQHLLQNVRLTGYLDDAALAAAYTLCTAFVWPTLYEGFGLPPLEAMACGAPVIVSDVASLPEVVGSAGVLLRPEDPAPWSEAMRRAAEEPVWRAALSQRSLAQAARFSWRRCASQTADCFRRVAGHAVDKDR